MEGSGERGEMGILTFFSAVLQMLDEHIDPSQGSMFNSLRETTGMFQHSLIPQLFHLQGNNRFLQQLNQTFNNINLSN